MLWLHAEFFQHTGFVHGGVGHGINQRYMAVHQLRHVLIAGRYHYLLIVLHRLCRQRADHVVGFDTFDD